MVKSSLWIMGTTRSGKTTRLVQEFQHWVKAKLGYHRNKNLKERLQPPGSAILVFAPNKDNRRNLAEKLSNAVEGSYPFICKTPLGFMRDEVILFWPLLLEPLQVKAQFPLAMRPETEQELATKLWRSQLNPEYTQVLGGEYQFVRRILDLLQLAGASGTSPTVIPRLLTEGLDPSIIIDPDLIGSLLLQWRQWCLERGLLTYGLIYELYWRYLLPDAYYREQLTRRYEAVFADDVDDYPAITRDLCEFLLDQGKFSVFTYNINGQIRLGLNADPEYLEGLADRCQIEQLPKPTQPWEDEILKTVSEPLSVGNLVEQPIMRALCTTSRAELLRKITEVIKDGVNNQGVNPSEIAIIAPGLDEIARYSLMEMLSHQGISLEPLNEQRPLTSSPQVRALLTLLGLVYPGLGRLVSGEAIAEMLVVLTQTSPHNFNPEIDPVRAGILADYCYQIDLEKPHLLPIEKFPRWDRLGYRTCEAYQKITTWVTQTRTIIEKEKTSPVVILNQAIKDFFDHQDHFNSEKLAVLRELMETAQHYWEVDRRLRQNQPTFQTNTTTIADFIQLLRRGTITANPYPVSLLGTQKDKITLATIFQYRSLRSHHRWHFWLDAGSTLWQKGGSAMLLGAPLFWRGWSGRIWTAQDELETDKKRLERILRDLLGRVSERIYLCHSDLGVNGNEQLGPLLSLVYYISAYY